MKQLQKNLVYLFRKAVTNPNALAPAIGVSQPNLHRLINGENRNPGAGTLQRLAEYFHVTTDQLLHTDLAAADTTTANVHRGPDIKGTVPVISWVQAGNWKEVIEADGDIKRVPTTYKVREHTYALRVEGDSMEPTFPRGCLIIVEPDEDALPGQYVIVRQAGNEATFKQLIQDGGTYMLKPINDRYPIMQMQPGAVFCGVVKQMMMEF